MTLILDIAGLQREVGQSLRFELLGDPSDLSLPEGVRLGPISVQGRALWTGETVLVEGLVGAEATLTCSRCLVEFTRHLSAPLSREFRPVDGGPARSGSRPGSARGWSEAGAFAPEDEGGSDAQGSEAEQPLTFSGETIDLGFPAWEALVLELPMKPVCAEACRGLCPVCGANLNERSCGCQAERADTRFLSLKKLLEAKERGE